MSTYRILTGDCRETLKSLPDQSIQCVVTSPPYWGLRSYLPEGSEDKSLEIGLEPTPDEYVAGMVAVFREVRRVLRDDGTLWLNLGDSYANPPVGSFNGGGFKDGSKGRDLTGYAKGSRIDKSKASGLKPKDLVGIPWRVAFALQADGWYLRQDIIWAKGSCMPESVTDRCTRSHEYLFMLTKRASYFYDAEAIKEPLTEETLEDLARHGGPRGKQERNVGGRRDGFTAAKGTVGNPSGKNKRSVWNVNPRPYSGAHFAVMPPLLVEPCILAGTSERGCCPTCGAPWKRVVEKGPPAPEPPYRNPKKRLEPGQAGNVGAGNMGFRASRLSGQEMAAWRSEHPDETVGWTPTCKCPDHTPVPCTVLDPFGGSGTVGMVARWHGRDSVLCELNPEYVKLIEERVEMERTETGGAKKPEPVVGGGASLDLLGDLFGGEG